MKKVFISLLNALGLGLNAYMPEPEFMVCSLGKFLGENYKIRPVNMADNHIDVMFTSLDGTNEECCIRYTVINKVVKDIDILS